ncbi:MAG: glycosyltransferase family 87 protein [Xanthobacteraceae bacterium]
MAIERFAKGAWLTPPLITFTAIMMIAGTIVALGFLLLTAHGTVDAYGRPLGTDFSSFWTAGRMALEGHAAAAYDWPAHSAFQQKTHGVDLFFPWSYPPIFLLVAAALASLPYLASLLVWQGATLLASLVVLRAILPGRQAVLLGLGFPAVLVCLGHGQTGFLTAALLAGGLVALPRHDIMAGLLFGLLAYKPQFGLILPFVLAATGHWRTIAVAAATVLAAVGMAYALWGWPVWQAFLDSLPLTRTIVLEPDTASFEKFQSAFAWMRLWGCSLPVAYALQAAVTAGALIGCVSIWRSAIAFRLKAAALLVATLLSSPYVLDYDFIVLGMALAFFVAEGIEAGFRPWEKTTLALVWIAPVAAREIAKLTFLPLGFLALVAIFLMIVMRVRAEHTERTARRSLGSTQQASPA